MKYRHIILLFAILISSYPVLTIRAEPEKIIGVPWDFQHKDTPMLCLQGCDYTGDHAWDDVHLEHRTHGDMYCVRASISMIANYFNNRIGPQRLSQDRITYYMTQGNGLGPEFDLKHSESSTPTETLAWALGIEPDTIIVFSYYYRVVYIGGLLDDNRPILAVWNGHARVIDGYKLVNNLPYFHILDPWPIMEPSDADKWVYYRDIPPDAVFLVVPAQAPGVRYDEDSIWLDSDWDGVCDFDEINRFFTNPYDEDSDNDAINDKEEILSYNYDYWGEFGPGYYYEYIQNKLATDYPVTVDGVPVALYYLRGNTPFFPYTRLDFSTGAFTNWHLNEPFIDLVEMRADIDGDGLRAELDYDSDGDGLPDNAEDKNRNGLFEWWLDETNPHIWDTNPPSTVLHVTPEYYVSDIGVKYITSQTVHSLHATDDAYSSIYGRDNEINPGIEHTVYRYYPASSADPPSFTYYGEPFQITGDPGQYILEYYSMDKHGNKEPVNTIYETLQNIELLEQEYVFIEGISYSLVPDFEVPEMYQLEWDFGPSIPTKYGKNPLHTFQESGVFTIILNVFDGPSIKEIRTLEAIVLDTSPIADFSFSGSMNEGEPVYFTDTSIPGKDDIVSWDWSFENKKTSLEQNPSHIFIEDGEYKVSLTVTDEDGSESTIIKTVIINNQAPTAILTANGAFIEGTPIDFSLIISDPGKLDFFKIDWDFDEYSAPTGFSLEPVDFTKPTHTYYEDGIYTVTVYVEDDEGDSVSVTLEIEILNSPPIVEVGLGTATINEGETFTRSGSFTDPGADIWTATVDYDDGAGSQTLELDLDNTFDLAYTYEDNGVYMVFVTVRDDEGAEDTATVTVTVNNVAPNVDAGPNDTNNEGDTFTNSGSFTDPGSDTWTATIDYGDGTGTTPLILTDKTFTLSHVYGDNGLYTVTVTVTDDDGASDTESFVVTVNNVAPTVVAGADQTVNEGISISLDPASFNDKGTQDTHTAIINWGDGTVGSGIVTETPTGPPGSTTGTDGTISGTHTYGDNGAYTVTVTVTDDDGGVGSDTLEVTVNNVAPTINSYTKNHPNPQFILPDVHSIDFTATFTDPGWLDTHTANWDYNDGTTEAGVVTEENIYPDSTGAVTGSHIYTSPGTYTVTITVTDDDVGAVSSTIEICIASVEEAVTDTNNYIQGLADSAFSKKALNQKKTLNNVFSAVQDKLLNIEYLGAINHLTAIRSLMDGEGKDWIIDTTALGHLQMKIDDIISYLETLL